MDKQAKLFKPGSQTFSDFVPFVGPVFSPRTTLKHLVPGKLNLPNIIPSNVWQARLDANAA